MGYLAPMQNWGSALKVPQIQEQYLQQDLYGVDWDIKPQSWSDIDSVRLWAVLSGSTLFAQTCLSKNLGSLG